eukprot:COSAG01_NODE_26989_length_697_cov_1.692308_2_plen_108_part_01
MVRPHLSTRGTGTLVAAPPTTLTTVLYGVTAMKFGDPMITRSKLLILETRAGCTSILLPTSKRGNTAAQKLFLVKVFAILEATLCIVPNPVPCHLHLVGAPYCTSADI